MPTINMQVDHSADDARNSNGGGGKNITATTQYLGKFSTTDFWNGWRWWPIAIPNAGTITSATLDLYSAGVTSGSTVDIILYGVNEDNIDPFDTGNKYPEASSRTTASVSKTLTVSEWVTAGFGIDTIDVTTLVQEIVNRPGWASGNAIGIVAHDNGSADSNSIGHSTFDRATDRGAKLTIVYESDGGNPVVTTYQSSFINNFI